MSIPKEPLDTSSWSWIIGTVTGKLINIAERSVSVQEGYLDLARERWEYSKEQTPEKIQQMNRHMDIQEQRIKLQQQKFVAEHGNWPGIDLEPSE